jgi:hypothetical protein
LHLVDILHHQVTNATEEYNGSTWAAGGNLNTARNALAGTGFKQQHLHLVENTYYL